MVGNMDIRLVVMRLADMHRVHPAMDRRRRCGQCNQPVGIYPSGQRVIAEFPTAEIQCHVCAGTLDPRTATPAPGALEEVSESVQAEQSDMPCEAITAWRRPT